MLGRLISGLRARWRHRRSEQALRLLEGRVFVDPTKALLLFASPRGGSTWLEEMLATIPRTATIWEPLDRVRNPEVGKLGFWARQHIPEDADWPEAEQMFMRLFSGQLLSPYLTSSTTPAMLASAERLVVKFVRGNLLLPWVTERFELPKPVLLVRHPCAVVASMKAFGAWDKNSFEQPPRHRYDGVVRQISDIIGPIHHFEEHLARVWCINNAWILGHPRNGLDWTTVTYEELVLNTEPTLRRIFSAWQMTVPREALEIARRPSRTTRGGNHLADPMAQLEQWRHSLSSVEQERILSIVSRCGVSLYSRELLPHQMTN